MASKPGCAPAQEIPAVACGNYCCFLRGGILKQHWNPKAGLAGKRGKKTAKSLGQTEKGSFLGWF